MGKFELDGYGFIEIVEIDVFVFVRIYFGLALVELEKKFLGLL